MLNLVGGFNFSNTESTRNGYKAIGFTEDQFGAPSFANGYPDGGKPSYSESTTRAASFYLVDTRMTTVICSTLTIGATGLPCSGRATVSAIRGRWV